jgi:large subunit ribosomal protein L4
MELQVVVPGQKAPASMLQVNSEVFGREYNEPLIHQVVTAYLAAARQGTAQQKTRAEVRGGGRKPFKQKGSGNARAGSIRSPLWRGGGVIFAARPRDYTQKVNKKMYRAALQTILSELVRQDRLIVVDSFTLTSWKTKELIAQLTGLGVYQFNTLIVSGDIDENIYYASRNLPNVYLQDGISVDPASLVGFEKVVVTVDGIKQLEERLG